LNREIIPINEIPNFQSRSEEFFPMDWYKKMLENNPVYYHEGTNTWNVFKYKDVKEVLSNYEVFSSEGPRTAIFVGAPKKGNASASSINLVNTDPPQHRKNRSLLAAAFTPRSLQEWEPRIEQIATELIEDFQEKETVNIVDALTAPLPSLVIADIFGVPIQDRHQFKKWVDILFQPYDRARLDEIEREKEKAAKEYAQYLYPIVLQKRANLADDVLSDLIRAEVDGEKFTDERVVQASMVLLGAGVETTSHMLTNTFYSLLYDNPSLYEEIRNDLDLVPQVVEEMLRYRFHVARRERTVKQDNDLLGVNLKKGDVVIAWMSAANVDGEVFEDPFTLNIHRPNNKRNLTFGTGPHICLGAPLARMEIAITLKVFLSKFSRIEPVESFDLESNLTASATGQTLTNLPVKLYR
jgi:cytochrome P450